MMAKYTLIKEFLEPPFLIEYAAKAAGAEASRGDEEDRGRRSRKAPKPRPRPSKPAAPPAPCASRSKSRPPASSSPTSSNRARRTTTVQRYKGLGEMTATQLWETTMDPERRTLLQVKLEDIAETEAIFTTLMGEDVEARRKFIEDNALDVKNLDI